MILRLRNGSHTIEVSKNPIFIGHSNATQLYIKTYLKVLYKRCVNTRVQCTIVNKHGPLMRKKYGYLVRAIFLSIMERKKKCNRRHAAKVHFKRCINHAEREINAIATPKAFGCCIAFDCTTSCLYSIIQ